MHKTRKFFLLGLGIFCVILGLTIVHLTGNLSVSVSVDSAQEILEELGKFDLERTDGGYYSFVDIKTKKEIDQTSRAVFEGDELILADNSRYRVVEIEGDTVYCEYLGKEDISWKPKEQPAISQGKLAQNEGRPVALYSTHTAESYVPTSGTESKPGDGDILKVGKTISNVLQEQGIKGIMSDNKHDPHDANAYQRSRRTAVQLLKQNPIALIDVHRDGVPDPNFYATEIDGKNATQIRLVVGRQNQNMQANLDFAKQIKAYYDEKKPGLIKGIFMAKGNYNQDLAPRSISIEVGTHTNSLEAAQNGAAVFASLLPEFLGVTGTPANQQPATETTRGTTSSLIWILLAVFVGGIVFLFISTGSLEGSFNKVRSLGKEFASFFGNIKGKDKK